MSLNPVQCRVLLAGIPAALLGACASDQSPPQPTAVAAAPDPSAAAPPEETPDAPLGRRPDARVEFRQTQVSFIGNAAWGRGTLDYGGRSYPFRMTGLGIGGVGASRVTAVGDVYGLRSLDDFAGLYGRLRAGAVLVEPQLRGGLWLRNPAGVSMNLRPRRRGLALQIGADGLLIAFA